MTNTKEVLRPFEESSKAFFSQWLSGDDLEAAIGWCESIMIAELRSIVEELEGKKMKTFEDDGDVQFVAKRAHNQAIDQAISTIEGRL